MGVGQAWDAAIVATRANADVRMILGMMIETSGKKKVGRTRRPRASCPRLVAARVRATDPTNARESRRARDDTCLGRTVAANWPKRRMKRLAGAATDGTPWGGRPAGRGARAGEAW